ncbi:hypothetical protein MBLNU13_g03692t1 [Cladosporium sp. NU13]
MVGRVEDPTHDGKLSAQAAESSARQNSVSPGRSALRIAVVLAMGFNISGFVTVYNTVKALVNYLHGIESLAKPATPLNVAIYICSGVLLATGFYLLIQRMTSTAHGVRSPIQKSMPLRYASIALCALWVEQDGIKKAVTSVMSYAYGEGVTLPRALFAICGELATALQMGLIWYKLVSKAFEPAKQKVASKQMHKDSKQYKTLSV